MSYVDSRAGNATSECSYIPSVKSCTRGDMSIVCLITVGAILLSISIAESDVPIGPTGQYHHYNHQHSQRLQRPIILEPVVKSITESSPLDWFFKMVSRVIEPPNKSPPGIIGPINLPGGAGKVYIRQLKNPSPWESNHVVIKMVTRDSVTGMNVPVDMAQSYHRSEDFSRRLPKSYDHRMNNPSGRSNDMFQQDYQASSTGNQYPVWKTQYYPRDRYHHDSTTKSLRFPAPNDFRYDDYSTNQNYDKRYFPSNTYRNENYQRFQPVSTISYRDSGIKTITSPSKIYNSISNQAPNESFYGNVNNDQRYKNNTTESRYNDFYLKKPDLPDSTENPYHAYALPTNDENFGKNIDNERYNENASMNNFPTTTMRYRQFVRNDRMIRNNRNHGSFVTTESTKFRIFSNVQDSRGFRHGQMTKFDLNDVGGIEIIQPPNLKQNWQNQKISINNESKDKSEKSDDGSLNDDNDSISMGNGENLARGESTEHVSDEKDDSQTSRIIQSRLSNYKVIDRSQRSHGSRRNMSLDKSSENFNDEDEIKPRNEKKVDEKRGSNGTSEILHNVMNLTARNRWKFQEGRQPTRIVKAIYRRRPTSEIVKNSSRESMESDRSNEKTNYSDNSSEN